MKKPVKTGKQKCLERIKKMMMAQFIETGDKELLKSMEFVQQSIDRERLHEN